MKAIVYTQYGPPEVLKPAEVAKPTPKADEILVKVVATTVTVADVRLRGFNIPASYWLIARLTLGFTRPKQAILGAELAGVVEAVGQDVSRFKPGDAVYAAALGNFGAYAEYKCLPEDGPVALKPANLSFEEAAAIPVGARTALHYLRKANLQPGQKILVYGASGSVGSYAVQLARHFGARVTAVCSSANLEWVKALGAERVIDYTVEDFSGQGELYDVIFAAVDQSSFADCIKALKPGGIYLNITQPFPNPAMLWAKMTSGKQLFLGENSPESAEALDYLGELVEAGELKVVVDRCYPLDEIVAAHRYVDLGHKKGNVVISVGGHAYPG